MARTFKLTFFVSVRSPLTSDKNIIKYWLEAANEFFQFWNEREIILFGKKRRVFAENIDPPKRILNRIKNQRTFLKNLPGHWGKLSCLVKQEDVAWLEKEWAENKDAPDPNIFTVIDLAFLSLTEEMERSLISSNLATVGAISLLDGAGISEPNYFRYYRGSGISYLDELFELTATSKSPLLRRLKIKNVQRWIERSPIWEGEISKTNVDRAICALAYLLQASGEAEELFWTLYGIEALIAESNSTTEIKRRIPLLLPGVDRKKISELYQYRSIVFHGKKNFRLPHYRDQDFETGDAWNRYKWVDYSKEIFLGALQELVRKNVRELSFKEKPIFKSK